MQDENILVRLLTPKEHDCFCFQAAAVEMKHIARYMGSSPRTIEIHRRNYRLKLGIKTPADFQNFLESHGLRIYCVNIVDNYKKFSMEHLRA